MNRYTYILVAVLLCSAVCAWTETSVPIVAVIPFEATGVTQDNADAFTARFAETLATDGTLSVAVRQAESIDALMTEVPGMCAELLGDVEK